MPCGCVITSIIGATGFGYASMSSTENEWNPSSARPSTTAMMSARVFSTPLMSREIICASRHAGELQAAADDDDLAALQAGDDRQQIAGRVLVDAHYPAREARQA